MGAGLDVATYGFGGACVGSALLSLGWGAWSARAALMPRWEGGAARLAEITIALTVAFGTAQLLGAVRLLMLGPLWAGEVAGGLAMGLLGARRRPPRDVRRSGARSAAQFECVVVAGVVAVVAAQWGGHVGYALTHGMTHPDTLWYHMPFSARFVQARSFPRLDGVGYPAAHWFPLNSQLLHTMVFLPFRRDVLSPYLNVGWAVLAVLAAWCIGQRRQVGWLSVAGAMVVLGLPVLAGTQPGQASTDMACGALLLAAVALLLESDLDPVPIGLAGAAAGLAISTKVTIAVPVLVLTLLVAGFCLLRRRAKSAGTWLAGVVISGSFWFGRNWVLTGNPLPWFRLAIGPLALRASVTDQGPTLVGEGLTNGTAWRDLYRPGLHHGLGAAWIAVLALSIAGAVLMVLHRGRPLDRIVGMVALSGMVGYLFTPQSAGFSFVYNLRYLSPMLLIGLVVLPLSLPTAVPWRAGQLVVVSGLIAVGAAAPHRERVPAWPHEALLPALAAGLAVAVFVVARIRPAAVGRTRAGRAVALAFVAITLVGWPLQRVYLDHRYASAGIVGDEAVPAYFRHVHGARVILFGSVESYPLFGPELSNRVRLGSDPPPHPGHDACRWWRSELRGRYDDIVLTTFGFGIFLRPPDDVIARDRSATVALRQGDSVIYHLRGPLHPKDCPVPTP